jgi:hypothetical protein
MPWPDYKTVTEQMCMLKAIQLAVKGYRHAYFIAIYSYDPLWDFLKARINKGHQPGRWMELKDELRVQTHAEV